MTDTKVLHGTGVVFEMTFPAIVIGAGATGLTAALALRDKGSEVLVLERDSTPLGSTATSTGLIPAAGTPTDECGDVGFLHPRRDHADAVEQHQLRTLDHHLRQHRAALGGGEGGPALQPVGARLRQENACGDDACDTIGDVRHGKVLFGSAIGYGEAAEPGCCCGKHAGEHQRHRETGERHP